MFVVTNEVFRAAFGIVLPDSLSRMHAKPYRAYVRYKSTGSVMRLSPTGALLPFQGTE